MRTTGANRENKLRRSLRITGWTALGVLILGGLIESRVCPSFNLGSGVFLVGVMPWVRDQFGPVSQYQFTTTFGCDASCPDDYRRVLWFAWYHFGTHAGAEEFSRRWWQVNSHKPIY